MPQEPPAPHANPKPVGDTSARSREIIRAVGQVVTPCGGLTPTQLATDRGRVATRLARDLALAHDLAVEMREDGTLIGAEVLRC